MRKFLFFSFFIFMFASYVQAQTTLVDEDFDGTSIPPGWVTYNLGDAACDSELWTFGSGVVPGSVADFTTNAAIFDDDSYGNDGNHNKSALWMYDSSTSLGFDLSSYGGVMTLAYEYALNETGNGEKLQVCIWDNTNGVWIVLKEYGADTDPTIDTVNVRSAILSNSGVDSANVFFGFIYDDGGGNWGWGAGVDNVVLQVYEAPDNDTCDNATNITGDVYSGSYSGSQDASGATNNAGYITLCGYDGTDDGMNDGVWYAFYAYSDGEVTVNMTPDSTWDAQIGVYSTDTDCSSLDCVGTADDGWNYGDPETITFDIEAGLTYYINFGSWQDNTDPVEGPFTFDVTFNCNGSAPANDLIADAIEVTPTTFSDTVNMACANAETGAFSGCNYSGLKTAFYKFHCTASSTVTATILNPEAASAAIFFEAPSLNAAESDLNIVAQGTNPCGVGDTYSITTTAGQDYYVVLTNGAHDTQITINGVVNTTGVSDQSIEGLSMYPNPVNDVLTVNAPENMKEINVFNIAGQRILHLTPDSTRLNIDTADWATGTYVVKVMTDDQVGVYHIMKE